MPAVVVGIKEDQKVGPWETHPTAKGTLTSCVSRPGEVQPSTPSLTKYIQGLTVTSQAGQVKLEKPALPAGATVTGGALWVYCVSERTTSILNVWIKESGLTVAAPTTAGWVKVTLTAAQAAELKEGSLIGFAIATGKESEAALNKVWDAYAEIEYTGGAEGGLMRMLVCRKLPLWVPRSCTFRPRLWTPEPATI
jgi:hypothetical protein